MQKRCLLLSKASTLLTNKTVHLRVKLAFCLWPLQITISFFVVVVHFSEENGMDNALKLALSFKERGNALYKEKKYKTASKLYTKSLDLVTMPSKKRHKVTISKSPPPL